MSKYNFDKITDRSNTYSLKWDIAAGELPMWVADMDFEVCTEITEYLSARIAKPIFGYNIIPDEWYDAYKNWWQQRHGWTFDREDVMFSTGVVPSVSSIVRRLTLPAEKVLLQTPVYNIFFNSVCNNGRKVIESPLVYKNGKYSVNFDDLEQKLADPQTTLMILCNPHNPIGIIWDKATLSKIGELCLKHHVTVLSDEIHCDIVKPDCGYTPFASASTVCRDISVTCIAPTKAFNIAGLQTSAIVVSNPLLRQRVWRGINNDEIAEPNTFAVGAAVAAFTKGEQWLEEMCRYVFENRRIVTEFLQKEIPQLKAVEGDATYLVWVDCSDVCQNSTKLTKYIREKSGLYLSDGAVYGATGNGFFRMNVACPRATLQDGLRRLKTAVKQFLSE